jgi:adenine-specific DNA-methyltransferase
VSADSPRRSYLVSYMGRSTPSRSNPFRFFLNHSLATATNGFLCLYPKPGLAAALEGHPKRQLELLAAAILEPRLSLLD